MNLNLVSDMLLKETKLLRDECVCCRNSLSGLKVLPDYINTLNKRKEELSDYIFQIDAHLNLDNRELISIDFYSSIAKYFRRESYKKRVKFSVQEGFDGEPSSKFSEDLLKKYFTISNCLPVMHIVPNQLANNAKKYMPADTEFTVELLVTSKKNFITMTNEGPHAEKEELERILSRGGRGSNTYAVNGMGKGLREIKAIVDLHQGWLDTSFSVNSFGNTYIYNDKPYSKFVVKMSYMNGSNEIDRDSIGKNFSDWAQDLPIILIHNMQDITTNLQLFCKDKLEKIPVNDYSNLWRKPIFKLRTRINRMVDVLNQCLFATTEKNEEDKKLILGNGCKVNFQKTIDMTLRNLNNTVYKEKDIHFDIASMQRLNNINATSSIYSFLTGFFSLVFDDLPSHAMLQITYECDSKGSSVSICCEGHDFSNTFETTEKDEILSNRISMYKMMLEMWKGEFKVKGNTINLYFWK